VHHQPLEAFVSLGPALAFRALCQPAVVRPVPQLCNHTPTYSSVGLTSIWVVPRFVCDRWCYCECLCNVFGEHRFTSVMGERPGVELLSFSFEMEVWLLNEK
jgi:hypothetical protein